MRERDRFIRRVQVEATSKRIGVAEGKFVVPDDFDACNNEIQEMFGEKDGQEMTYD